MFIPVLKLWLFSLAGVGGGGGRWVMGGGGVITNAKIGLHIRSTVPLLLQGFR